MWVMKLRTFRNFIFKRKRLFLTNIVMTVFLTGLGDLLAQYSQILQKNTQEWDKIRTSEMALCGIPMGAYTHLYYRTLDNLFPGKSAKAIAKKVVADQLICGPIGLFIFLISITCVQGFTVDDFKQNVKQNSWKLVKADFMVWPPAQIINYCFVGAKYRVLYDNIVSLGCNVYRSYVHYDS